MDPIGKIIGFVITTKKFKQYIVNTNIIIKNTLIEIHHSLEMIKHYHGSL